MIRVPAAAERNTKSAAEKIYKEMNAAGNSRRDDGVWRSLVARSAGGREVAGSNPVTPIFLKGTEKIQFLFSVQKYLKLLLSCY